MNIWVLLINITSITCAIISVLLNSLLIFVFFKCSAKSLSAFKYFFFLFATVDIFFSIVQATFVPISVGKGASVVFLAAGFGGHREYGFVGLLLFFTGSLFVLLVNLNSFLYRFILLCRPNLIFLYASIQYVWIIVALNIVLIVDWTYSVFRTMPATAAFTTAFRQTVLDIVQIDIYSTAHFGFNNEELGQHPFDVLIFSQFFIITVLIFTTIVYCVHRILSTLKRAAISSHARKLHSRMFKLLTLQVLTPVTFLFLPCIASSILVAINAMNIDYICTVICSLYAIFPLISPVIILHYVKDYRVYLLRLLRLDKTPRHRVNTRTT